MCFISATLARSLARSLTHFLLHDEPYKGSMIQWVKKSQTQWNGTTLDTRNWYAVIKRVIVR